MLTWADPLPRGLSLSRVCATISHHTKSCWNCEATDRANTHQRTLVGVLAAWPSLRSCFEATCTSWHSRISVFIGDTKEFFRAELKPLELNSPEMKPNTFEEMRVGTQGDCLLSVPCQFLMVAPDKSRAPSVLHHYYPCQDEPAVYHDVLYKSHKVIIPLQLYSLLWWENSTKATTVVNEWCIAPENWRIGKECKQQFSKKMPIAQRVPVRVHHCQKKKCFMIF